MLAAVSHVTENLAQILAKLTYRDRPSHNTREYTIAYTRGASALLGVLGHAGDKRATIQGMRERATLRLDAGDVLRVEVDREDLDDEEIVVRRAVNEIPPARKNLVEVIDKHLRTAKRHPDGTTDRLLQADRDRPY